jgi:hypothetical protein
MLMDNNQTQFGSFSTSMPPVQPVQSVQPVQPQQPMQPGQQVAGVPQSGVAPAPMVKKDVGDIIKIVTIVILSLISVTFIGLFIWMFMKYDEASTDVNGQIQTAVAAAVDEKASKDEAEFLEREKYPYQYFTGPADYGQLTFQYPKTWSVYVAADASNGGNFEAYFNPVQVNVVSNDTIMSLRVTVRDEDFESVVGEYQELIENSEAKLSMSSVTFNGITANKYTGTLPGTDFNGYIVIFKIRDKTAILQTDSVLFETDFNRLLDTVQFNA